MNIQAQMCGIILLVTMFLFYKRYQSLKLGTQIMFQVLLFGMLFCVICDMLSIWAIVRLLLDYRGLVLAVCKLYLISLVLVGLLGLLYECSDVYEGQKIRIEFKFQNEYDRLYRLVKSAQQISGQEVG